MNDLQLLGINAPVFTWAASIAVAILAAYQIIRLLLISHRFESFQRATKVVNEVRKQGRPQARSGLNDKAFDTLRRHFQSEPGLAKAWDRFQDECLEVPDADSSGEVSYFRTGPAGEVFSEAAVVESQFNLGWFMAFPGILTGIGLLVTFAAILVAMMGLKVGNGEVVEGIKPLIAGLSGKFLSSIVALLCATLFMFAQSPIVNGISRRRAMLCNALDELIPLRNPAGMIKEIAVGIAEQTNAFKNFGTNLSMLMRGALRDGMTESIGPQQERMVVALEGLNTLMRTAETTKQESMTGELTSLLRSLESSMTATMNGMGDRFSEALTGSASTQLERVIASLDSTAGLVERMNAHSAENQVALSILLDSARQGSMEQMALGKRQVEDLTATLQNLMVQLNDSAGTSVNQMSATLTAVVHELSTKVGALSNEVSTTMLRSSADATGAAKAVLSSAASWSEKSEAGLHAILERLVDDSRAAESTRKLLDSTLGGFQLAIASQAAALADMRSVASQMAAATSSMAGALKTIDSHERSLLGIAEGSEKQVAALERMVRISADATGTLEHYTKVFADAERKTEELLRKVGGEVQQLTSITAAHFATLMENTDNHLGDAVKKLGGSVNELGDTLDDLHEVLGKARPGGQGRSL